MSIQSRARQLQTEVSELQAQLEAMAADNQQLRSALGTLTSLKQVFQASAMEVRGEGDSLLACINWQKKHFTVRWFSI